MDSAGGGAPWRGQRSHPSSGSGGPTPGAGSTGNQQGPPSAIQGAMMKDKKPFTYTPGGIDLSEIRSPRMAKRIQMNAAAEGVTSVPPPNNNSLAPGPGYQLPPASIAAMQPQVAVAVFPQGGPNPATLHKTHKPSDYHRQPSSESSNTNGMHAQHGPPPPPPPPMPPSQFQNLPPPPPERFSTRSPNSEARAQKFSDTHKEAVVAPRPTDAPPLSLASFMKQTIKATPDYDEDSSTEVRAPSPQSVSPRPMQQQQMNSHPPPPQLEQRPHGHRPVAPPQQVNPQPQQDQRSPQIDAQDPMQNHTPKMQPESRSPQLYSQRPMSNFSNAPIEQQNQVHIERQGQPATKLYHHNQQQQRPETTGPPPPVRQNVRSPPIQHQPQANVPLVEQKIPMHQPENEEQAPLVFQQIPSAKGPQVYQQRPVRQFQPAQPQPQKQANSSRVINLGTLYIPPIEQRSAMNDKEEGNSSSSPGLQRTSSVESDSDKEKSAPQTPQLNKAPRPWMNSQNRVQSSSPSFTQDGNTPWGKAKVIPINLVDNRSSPVSAANTEPEDSQAPIQVTPIMVKAKPGGRTTPVSMTNGTSTSGMRIIPIQFEGASNSKPTPPQSARTPATPTTNSRSNPYFMQNQHQKQTGESSVPAERSTGDDSPRMDPTQSKSFRVLQKITDDGDTSPSTQQQQSGGHSITIRMEPATSTAASQSQPQSQHSAASQQQYQFPVEYIAPENPKVHPSQQKVSEPKLYMGKNIPSRSFKMLQQLTGEDGPSNSAFGSKGGDDHSNISYPLPLPLPSIKIVSSDPCPNDRLQVGGSSEFSADNDMVVVGEKMTLDVPEDFDPNDCNWDPTSYWYYWWYCASHFWNGSEYVFPEGWEPYNGRNFVDYSEDQDDFIPSIQYGEIHGCGTLGEHNIKEGQAAILDFKPLLSDVPESEESETDTYNEKSERDCDIFGNATNETGKELDAKLACDTNSSDLPPGVELDSGIVEEPETPTSLSDLSSPPIADGSNPNIAGLLIEEYFSDDSELASIRNQKRLSTIDELSENEKSLSAIIASISSKKNEEMSLPQTIEDSSDDLDLSTSDEETSHASVIESKREAETDTGGVSRDDSTSESETEGEEDELDELNSAISARLPITLSFSKSKSYKDITTVLIGDAEVKSGNPNVPHDDDNNKLLEEYERGCKDLEDMANQIKQSQADASGSDEKNPEPEVDFWSEIMQSKTAEENSTEIKGVNLEAAAASDDDNESVDFWSVLNNESEHRVEEDVKEKAKEDVNFWEKQDASHNFWERPGNFQFTFDNESDHLLTTTGTMADVSTLEIDTAEEGNDDTSTEDESHSESTDAEPSSVPLLNEVPTVEKEELISCDTKESEPVTTLRQNSNKSDDVSDESKSSDERTIIAPEEKSDNCEDPKDSALDTEKEADGLNVVITREVPINVADGSSTTCNCLATEKLARAENLLWRIEKFLQETLFVGSENDSGILTDISRQLSDYETDYEGEIEIQKSKKDEEFQTSQPETPGPQTEPVSREGTEGPEGEKAESVPKEEPEVKMRGTEAERNARKYERAKTHSRLFELLQGEGEREEALPEESEEESHSDAKALAEDSTSKENYRNVPIELEQDYKDEVESNLSSNSSGARSRLIPLPIKSCLTSSLSIDSNSSYSGSSSMLSPTSPNRDQLLTDIISQFQQRHQNTIRRRFKNKRVKHFPSKIFNILQQEFGQEFYDVFDFGDDFLSQQIPVHILGKGADFYDTPRESITDQLEEHKDIEADAEPSKSNEASVTSDDDNFPFRARSAQRSPKEKLGRDLSKPKSFKKF